MDKLKDPIFLEISWNRLISFVDEAAAALVRTAFSSIIREAQDYACVLFDAQGRSLAQSTTSVPSFIGTLPHTMRHFQQSLGTEGWAPGDVVITNDPWIGSGHLQDISMVAPISIRRAGWWLSAALSRIRPTWVANGRRNAGKSTRKACRFPSAS